MPCDRLEGLRTGYSDASCGGFGQHRKFRRAQDNPITPNADHRRVILLYRHAQPAPVVPPAIEPDYKVIKSILPTANPDEYACCIAADMWNACRSAMLNGGKS
ncbi:hypothetical protein E2V02_19540 [Salmonella enterica]|uniref:Uncharacterized protein n=1 Tax=Salmonella enterica subsp. houtenae serovar 48:g,z51:- TaxID=1050190 RepID=A0A727THK0_SALHO|nr:hypothetical protein [Salmonella enterica]ECJ2486128.1 hypothetical protein [Salmonella enterica subsp. houtenae]EDP9792375.1 hypothetical protein [Salmonella enterica subsp. salamae]EDS0025546.1 hypothetical protein [Salmonella enterica subsp. enterica serovar Carswell]EEE0985131.1 hypothetical protein [Salmonella enterica subsp. enterica serovar Kiambu]HAE2226451.1 hypothetical protein [Salmonella enterica subsp. houtenae serovar 48:g,z51:-]